MVHQTKIKLKYTLSSQTGYTNKTYIFHSHTLQTLRIKLIFAAVHRSFRSKHTTYPSVVTYRFPHILRFPFRHFKHSKSNIFTSSTKLRFKRRRHFILMLATDGILCISYGRIESRMAFLKICRHNKRDA